VPGRLALLLLAIAALAMAALHVVQPALDPYAEPVSFYVHGAQGWLLPIALGAFGAAALALARAIRAVASSTSCRLLALFGAGMLVTAVIPSDAWFPWEARPSWHGLIHAAAAMLAPALLLFPMVATMRLHPAGAILAVVYGASLLVSATSLAVGFLRDEAPPAIGLAERILALAAVAWLILAAARPLNKNRTAPAA
jgi:hypothetical protein